MPKQNSFEKMAGAAAVRLDKARAAGQQLTFLPDETPEQTGTVETRRVGRPPGAQNKGSSEFRKYLAAQGCRMPEDVLAEMAGLTSRDPAVVCAMQQSELVMAWAFDGQTDPKTSEPATPSPAQRVQMFTTLYTHLLRAADALLPYGLGKASSDVEVNQAVQINLVAGAAAPAPADLAVVESGRMVPADVAFNNQQNQGVEKGPSDNSDG